MCSHALKGTGPCDQRCGIDEEWTSLSTSTKMMKLDLSLGYTAVKKLILYELLSFKYVNVTCNIYSNKTALKSKCHNVLTFCRNVMTYFALILSKYF